MIRKDKIVAWEIYELCGTWNICAEKLINYFTEQLDLSILTKFHGSDITDEIKQANQGRVISFRIPFMSMKGRIFGESDYA